MRIVNKVLQAVKENVWLLLLFALLIGGAISLQVFGKDVVSSLGANLVSELIGAALTVYGIDYLIKRRERRKLLPLLASSYEDVRIMTHWALDLWKDIYISSVGDSEPKSWQELLSEDYLKKMGLSMDVRRLTNTIPPMTWYAFIDMEMDRIHKHAEKILERHGHALDPSIHSAIYSIVYYNHHKIANSLSYDQNEQIPRPFNLGGYMPLIREWFDSVIFLHEWTIETHEYLEKNGISKIHPPYLFRPLVETTSPSAKLDYSDLIQQHEKFRTWQQL